MRVRDEILDVVVIFVTLALCVLCTGTIKGFPCSRANQSNREGNLRVQDLEIGVNSQGGHGTIPFQADPKPITLNPKP